jgi:magnesium transporter
MPITQILIDSQKSIALACDAPRPDAGEIGVWLDVTTPSEEDLAWLARTYPFHPLTIEDLRNFNQRSKVESYDGYLFLSLVNTVRDNGDVRPQELEVFLGSDYLITVHREPLAALDDVRARLGGTDLIRGHPDFLLWLIVDHMVDSYFPLIDEMEDEIDNLEDEILENATQATLQRIYAIKRQLVLLRKITAPMRDVMNALAGTRYQAIGAHTALYFRDAYDHLSRIYDLIETSRDLLGNALDIYLSTVSNRLGEIMKRLTLLTTVFMPISFLVGFGGMNFQQLPFNSPIAFSILMALIVFVPMMMVIWFWRSRWV